jgi:hypothetical protein
MSVVVANSRSTFSIAARTLFATLAAGPVGAMIYGAGSTVWSVAAYGTEANFLSLVFALPVVALWGAMIGWLAMLLGGLPVHALFYALGWQSGWAYTPAGAVVGACAGLAFAILMGASPLGWQLVSSLVQIGAITGAISGLVFWLIRRPDRDASADEKPV